MVNKCIFNFNIFSQQKFKKTNDSKVLKLGIGNDLGIVIWFWDRKVKGQLKVRVNSKTA